MLISKIHQGAIISFKKKTIWGDKFEFITFILDSSVGLDK